MRNCFLIPMVLFYLVSVKAQSFNSQELNLGIQGYFGDYTVEGGSGVSFADFDKDGLDDLTFSSEDEREIYLFKNHGNKFELLSNSVISNVSEGRQVLWIDYDNDNDKDLFYVTFNDGVFLYQNNGSFVFSDVTNQVGLPTNLFSATGASFGDINNDGYLDLYISNYLSSNKLYHFNGFIYQDISLSSGTDNGLKPTFCASFIDYNNDGLQDIYVSNDKVQNSNALYKNLGFMLFEDVSINSNTDLHLDAMNVGIGDYNQDGHLDIYVTDTQEAALLTNQGDGTFVDLAPTIGVIHNRFAWAGNFLDVENDGDLDLYVSTGLKGMLIPSALYINDNFTFTEPFLNSYGISQSDTLGSFVNVIGDFNNNGYSDIATGGQGNNDFRFYMNLIENDNSFLKLNLVGNTSNKDAYGAKLVLYTSLGARTYIKQSANAYLCQNSDYLNIGLRQNELIDSMIIKWPVHASYDTIYGSQLMNSKMFTIEENIGVVSSTSLDLCLINHEVLSDTIPSQKYRAVENLSCSKIINPNSNVLFSSESVIVLNAGFEVPVSGEFEALIETCSN